MIKNRISQVFSGLVLLALLAMTVILFKPFLVIFIWAVMITAGLRPFYNRLLKRIKKPSLCAFIMCFSIFALLMPPFLQVSYTLYSQSMISIDKLNMFLGAQKDPMDVEPASGVHGLSSKRDLAAAGLKTLEKKINLKMSRFLPSFSIRANIKNILFGILGVFEKIPELIARVSGFLVDLVFLFIFMFYLFRDGTALLEFVKKYLPFEKSRFEVFVREFKQISRSTIISSFIVAVVQGALGFVIFLILGFGEPVVWGAFISIFSIIPIIGTSIIWFPAALYIIIKGSYIKGIILILWGVFVIGMADNLLRPFLIKDKVRIHQAVLFFCILGGINTFGILGVFLGPVILVFLVTALEMYNAEKNTYDFSG